MSYKKVSKPLQVQRRRFGSQKSVFSKPSVPIWNFSANQGNIMLAKCNANMKRFLGDSAGLRAGIYDTMQDGDTWVFEFIRDQDGHIIKTNTRITAKLQLSIKLFGIDRFDYLLKKLVLNALANKKEGKDKVRSGDEILNDPDVGKFRNLDPASQKLFMMRLGAVDLGDKWMVIGDFDSFRFTIPKYDSVPNVAANL